MRQVAGKLGGDSNLGIHRDCTGRGVKGNDFGTGNGLKKGKCRIESVDDSHV